VDGRGGVSRDPYGATDEVRLHAVKDKVHMHDLHATLLWLLGYGTREADVSATPAADFRRPPCSGRCQGIHGVTDSWRAEPQR